MMKILLLVLLLSSCANFKLPEPKDSQKKEELPKDTTAYLEIKNHLAYFPEESEPFTGKYEVFYENGNKAIEMYYKRGLPSGLMTQWYETGQKKLEVNYKEGNEDGLFIGWNKDGTKNTEISYTQGQYSLTISNAKNLYAQKHYKIAFVIYKQLAEQENLNAQFHLAYMYRHGLGTKADVKLAHQWFQKVARAIAHRENQ